MPPVERDAPRELPPLKHQHSASTDHVRALVPMWDSSDPERAPPPLPMHPQSPNLSRPGTSPVIQSAHAAIAEKARENSASLVPHRPKRIDSSPERNTPSPTNLRSSHRRTQSTVKDLSLMLEATARGEPVQGAPRSPEKSDRPVTPQRRDTRDAFLEAKDYSQERSSTSTPTPGPSLTPIIRPIARRSHQNILGENAPPPSATMIALQNMSAQSCANASATTTTTTTAAAAASSAASTTTTTTTATTTTPSHPVPAPQPAPKEPGVPLANITNGSSGIFKTASSLESLSHQILTLTDIATTLQKEMATLSRRSRDNATDLLSLKEATNARDEDIRKSLRELISDVKNRGAVRDPYGGPLMMDGRHHPSSPTQSTKSAGPRPFSLPRIPSPTSFFDRESLLSTPSLVSDTAPSPATVALLEKIIREMGTKEGQENLLGRLTELAEKLSGMATAGKLEELVDLVRSAQQQALVPAAAGGGRGGGGDGGTRDRGWGLDDDDDNRSHRSALDFLHAATAGFQPSDRSSAAGAAGDAALHEEILKAIRGVKDSVTQGGGLTAETKALVRELRGEVLGMGRDIGRRLDEVAEKSAATGQSAAATKADVMEVIDQGLAEMTQQMSTLLREHRRQSFASAAIPADASRGGDPSAVSAIDYKEIYNSVRAALKDTQAGKPRGQELRREDVVQAVKDAWEKYKPEIEIQQIGLEREEVLACLEEGLRAYAPRDDRPPGATRDEVHQAVAEALKKYIPPKVDMPPPLTRDDLMEAVRECLEEFEFPVAPGMGLELTRADVLEAVKEGLRQLPQPAAAASAADLTKGDVLNAVSEGLQAFDFSAVYANALVPQSVTKGDVSDAVRSGLKGLDLSSEIMDAVREGLDGSELPTNVAHAVMQAIQSYDFAAAVAAGIPRPDLSRVDVSDAVREGIESLDLNGTIAAAVKDALRDVDFSEPYSKALVPASAIPRSASPPVGDVPRANVADAADLSRGIADAVKTALDDFDFSRLTESLTGRPDLSRVEVADAVKEALEALDLSQEVADAVKRSLESFDPASLSRSGADLSRGDVVDAVKEGLGSLDLSEAKLAEVVKKELQAFDFPAARANASTPAEGGGGGSNDEVLRRLLEIKELLQAEIKAASAEAKESIAANARDTEKILDAARDGFEKLRADIEGYVDRAKAGGEPEQVSDQLLLTLDSFREELANLITKSSDVSKTMLREEIDSLRDAVNSSLVPVIPHAGNHGAGNKEVLEALHEGIHALRKDIGARPIAGLTEILDALEAGFGDIRASITNLRDKPADLTANDEILDALKEGLDSVRADIEALRQEAKTERSLAAVSPETASRSVVPADQPALTHDDIKNLEALIAQLGTKVEALESAPRPSVSPMSKEDLEHMDKKLQDVSAALRSMPNIAPLESLEASIRKIQDTVDELATREHHAPPKPALTDPATREDVEAIETILRNTKAKLDDFMDGEQMVKKDHIDSLETMILEARESVGGLANQVDGVSRKEHIDALEKLVEDTRQSLGGLAAQVDSLSRREDVAMVESLVNQVVAAFDEMKERHEKALEDPEKVTKTDVEAVEAVCLDTKSLVEHIQKVDLLGVPSKEDIEALEARLGDLRDRIDAHAEATAKAFEERQAETVGVGVGIAEVKTILEKFETVMASKLADGARGVDSIHNILDALAASVRKNDSLSDGVKEVLDTVKLEFEDSKTAMVGVKLELDEKLQSNVDAVVAKLDERLGELATKHEELQLVLDDRATKAEARDADVEAAVGGTKAIAEELKTLVDTLGSAVTDSLEKMEEASKTVFVRVEDLAAKADENHAEAKTEHQLTREQVQEAIGKVDGLQGQVAEYQPKILETVQELMVSLADRYETLKTTAAAIHERVENPILPPPPEKYDDAAVLERLDALVGHTAVADKAFEQLGTLDQVHEQVKAVAAELSAFLAAQTQRIADEREERERSLQETTIALERRKEEKEQVDALVATLREEELRLREVITVTLPEEQAKVTEQFLANLMAEEARLKESTAKLVEEQEQLKASFLANLQEEQARLMEATVALKEEQDKLKEAFLGNLREEEQRLKEMNDALRDEQQLLKDGFLSSLREEEALLKEVNAGLRKEQDELRELFAASLKEEQERLRAANDALRQEQETIKATLKEDQERFKVELLANLMEEEARLKEANAALRAEQEAMRAEFLAALKEEESRLRDSLQALRDEQEGLQKQKNRLTADLSALDTALRIRREELDDMEQRAESLERRILEGVMDHSRVLLMAKTNRATAAAAAMNRKRVSSAHKSSSSSSGAATTPGGGEGSEKPRSSIAMAMASRSKGAAGSSSSPAASGSASSAARRIFSLTQITNNVPVGGIKRSQSVRTAGGPGLSAARSGSDRHRKTSWGAATGGGSKGYGDLGLGGSASAGEDKENLNLDIDLEDLDGGFRKGGDAEHDAARELAPPAEEQSDDEREEEEKEEQEEEEVDDDDRFSDLGGPQPDDETRSLRRSSHGTTVINPEAGEGREEQDDEEEDDDDDDDDDEEEPWSDQEGQDPRAAAGEKEAEEEDDEEEEEEEEEDDDDDDDDDDDAASDWTESVVGKEEGDEEKGEAMSNEAAAPAAAATTAAAAGAVPVAATS
ncbi:hypothetical protein VTJ83DRAFT_6246 [Remersonia thermophila]|uniref:Transport protein USO1 n=1 Tax=Remersonia thermophila TaxID=72144 RepID=A0ABR4D5N7_9PEZI